MIRLALRASLACLIVLAACSKNSNQTFQGWIEANLIFVSPDETGRIEKQPVREGDRVEPKTLLFTLDDDLQRADVAEREAAVENAKQAYNRAVALLKTAAGTQKSYDEAEAALRSTQARLNSSQTKLARRRAFSPADGTVQQIYFRVGELVPAGRPVVAILPPGNMKVRFFVNEAALPTIAPSGRRRCRATGSPTTIWPMRPTSFRKPLLYPTRWRGRAIMAAGRSMRWRRSPPAGRARHWPKQSNSR